MVSASDRRITFKSTRMAATGSGMDDRLLLPVLLLDGDNNGCSSFVDFGVCDEAPSFSIVASVVAITALDDLDR